MHGQEDIAREIIIQGGATEDRDMLGRTALDWAVLDKNMAMIKLLQDSDCQALLKKKSGKGALKTSSIGKKLGKYTRRVISALKPRYPLITKKTK